MEGYIVSARKYRPQSFDAVVGQHALTTTLRNAVKSGKLAHAYLFCGPRGVGKTTCARIFARAINCAHPTAEGDACGHCESCEAFAAQRSLGIFELDAASNNSVEHIKTLMDQTRIPPQTGRYKVFIIDEVHMLSTAAFNAFLKTLEEPPAHVIFILATTEKHKILPTILSRCQIYDFERMSVADTISHLAAVALKEGIEYEEEALAVIAEKADGGMRDALSIFDQVASFCQGHITYAKVIEDLNVLDAEYYFKIVDHCLGGDVRSLMLLVNTIIGKGFDGGLLIGGLASHVRNLLMARDEATLPLLETSEGLRQKYKEQALRSDVRWLYRALKQMNNCDINYRQSSNKRLLVELTLIEMAQAAIGDDADGVAGRPPRRLKPLFNKEDLVGAPREEPDQAPSRDALPRLRLRASASDPRRGSSPEEPAPAPKPTTTYRRGIALNLKEKDPNADLSLSNLKRKFTIPAEGTGDQGGTPPQGPPSSAMATNAFTQDDLARQWTAFLASMPKEESFLRSRMTNLTPLITDFPEVEVVVSNDDFRDEVVRVKGRIESALRSSLNNDLVKLTVRVVAPEKDYRPITRREQFDYLAGQNPAVDLLRELLDLKLA